MNQQSKIAVIGAGVMGLSAAHALSHAHNVALFDPDRIPGENASAMAGGMLAPYSEIDHLPPEFISAGLEGIKFWAAFKPHETGFMRNGTLLVAHKEDTYILDRFAEKLPGFKKTDIAKLEPSLNKFTNGIFLPDEAHLSPLRTMYLLSHDLNCHVRNFNLENNKNYDWVIDCRGLAANDPELRGVKGETIIVKNTEFSLNRPVRLMHPRYPLYIVPHKNHEFIVGATVIESTGSRLSVKSAMELLSATYSLHPSFGEAEIVATRVGTRPAYPDNLPRIKIAGNVISCNGLFRHGYLLAPVMAECVADFIAGQENKFMNLFTRTHDNDQRAEEKTRRRA